MGEPVELGVILKRSRDCSQGFIHDLHGVG